MVAVVVAVVVVVRCDLGPSGGGYRPQDLAPKGGSLPGLASNGLRIGRIAATLACEGAPICELKGRLQRGAQGYERYVETGCKSSHEFVISPPHVRAERGAWPVEDLH